MPDIIQTQDAYIIAHEYNIIPLAPTGKFEAFHVQDDQFVNLFSDGKKGFDIAIKYNADELIPPE